MVELLALGCSVVEKTSCQCLSPLENTPPEESVHLSCPYSHFHSDHLLKSSQEEFGKILKDNDGLNADHFLSKDQRESRPETAFAHKGQLKLLLQIVGLEVIGIVSVPLGTLLPVPFPLAVSVRTSFLAIFESWMRRKPAAADPARAFLPTQVILHGSVPLIRYEKPFLTRHRDCAIPPARSDEDLQLSGDLYTPESESPDRSRTTTMGRNERK